MPFSLEPSELKAYVCGQLNHLFPDGRAVEAAIEDALPATFERLEHCFHHIGQFYYRQNGRVVFNHLNTDQYAAFLYLLSNVIHKRETDRDTATKLYALNKALHGLDVFYAVELPSIFCFTHPVGTVIGRAVFQDYFCAYQNVTVGGDLDGNLPTIGRGVVMYGGSRVVGRSVVGDNVLISAGASILGQEIPSGMVASGASPNILLHPTRRDVVRDVFEDQP